jgi:hypothetical protein
LPDEEQGVQASDMRSILWTTKVKIAAAQRVSQKSNSYHCG